MDSLRLLAHPSELRDDYASALVSVWRDGLALELVSRELQSCRSIVLTAVRQNGLSIQFATSNLQRDAALAAIATRQTDEANFHIPEPERLVKRRRESELGPSRAARRAERARKHFEAKATQEAAWEEL